MQKESQAHPVQYSRIHYKTTTLHFRLLSTLLYDPLQYNTKKALTLPTTKTEETREDNTIQHERQTPAHIQTHTCNKNAVRVNRCDSLTIHFSPAPPRQSLTHTNTYFPPTLMLLVA